MTLQLIDSKKKIFFYIFIFLFLSTIKINFPSSDNLISFKIRDISVTGLSHNNNMTISQKLTRFQGRNIFSLNESEFNEILEKFNIVESYEIKKIFPNKIELKLKRTNFIAFTFLNNTKYIIGENNKLIDFDELSYGDLNLPIVFTNDNFQKFKELKEIIEQTNFNFKEVESFYYFKIGRWDLKTKDGMTIKLPTNDIKEAMNRAHIILHDKNLNKLKLLDMRIENYIIISNE